MKAIEIVILLIVITELVVTAFFHGQPKGNHNIFYKILDSVIFLILFYWAGLFH